MNATEIRTRVEITRRIDRTTDEGDRYATSAAEVRNCPGDVAEVYVTTTDCRMMAINRFDGKTEKVELIPAKLLSRKKSGSKVELNGQWENADGKFEAYDPDNMGRFPNAGSVVDTVLNDTVEDVPVMSLGINAKSLMHLAESIGSDEVRLVFRIDEKEHAVCSGIAVSPINVDRDGSFGIIMPMHLDRKDCQSHIAQLAVSMRDYVETCKKDEVTS
jgi:hypothetical protein